MLAIVRACVMSRCLRIKVECTTPNWVAILLRESNSPGLCELIATIVASIRSVLMVLRHVKAGAKSRRVRYCLMLRILFGILLNKNLFLLS